MKKNKLIGAFLSVLIIASGCTPTYHVKKARKHTKKALSKGVVIPKDTIIVNKFDTLVKTYTKNDTTYIEKLVTKTITLEPTIEIRTKRVDRWMTKYKYKTVRVENKAMIDSLKQVVRIERQKKGIAKAENRKSKWWAWLLLGIVVGYLINSILAIKGVVKRINKL